ncbi:hypothetical protein BG004_005560 [Podila humilis]|nr:hypothetical protein BG004_005560 [Podila humilis]
MSSSSSPRSTASDTEKGLLLDSPSTRILIDNPLSTPPSFSPLTSPTSSPNSSSSFSLLHPPAPSSSLLSLPLSTLSSLRRVIKRNPTTVVGGRFIISLRQVLAFAAVCATLTVFSAAVVGSNHGGSFLFPWGREYALRQQQDKLAQTQALLKNYALDDSENPALLAARASYTPWRYNTQLTSNDVVKDREERVRGKATRSSLKKIQYFSTAWNETESEKQEREMRLRAVRRGFEHAWQGYRKYAWGHDEIKPVSGSTRDPFNGWGATMIDSLDTLLIMGFHQEFDEALEWIRTSFDFTKEPKRQLPFFETVIRYLGGFLSAYELSGEQLLLDKAKELGSYMLNSFKYGAFPQGRVTIDPKYTSQAYTFNLAEIGTIQLEFTRLSQLSGNPVYEQKARAVISRLNSAVSEIPGLYPEILQDTEGINYKSFAADINGGADSFYEYLLKDWILLDGKDNELRDMFVSSVDSMQKYMVSRPSSANSMGATNFAIIGTVSTKTKKIEPQMGHLGCFIAGSLAMGSKYFDRPQDMTLARQVAEACYLSYHHTITGLGPEHFRFRRENERGTVFKVERDTFFYTWGIDKNYILRPEAIESLWILFRLTGDKTYQDKAWEMFQDVTKPRSYDNKMESFFLAETLKYFYLIFSPPDVISLDDFVLNTEAHPLRRM